MGLTHWYYMPAVSRYWSSNVSFRAVSRHRVPSSYLIHPRQRQSEGPPAQHTTCRPHLRNDIHRPPRSPSRSTSPICRVYSSAAIPPACQSMAVNSTAHPPPRTPHDGTPHDGLAPTRTDDAPESRPRHRPRPRPCLS
ncbi:hypothetical protein FA95DRAFT_347874 [Auriscalpium vulgare]|uniref:Uncharacterized protein n=1 Tax=Auriscalpium vulgare TaxID=40419 RepID=A0ACB8RI12_9AGAM|nr:hypothetical protein FA95DRAFT_347874 [Auriscalpium vulgare]